MLHERDREDAIYIISSGQYKRQKIAFTVWQNIRKARPTSSLLSCLRVSLMSFLHVRERLFQDKVTLVAISVFAV